MRTFLQLTILMLVGTISLNGQTVIQGKITDATQNDPLTGAFVSIGGTELTTVSEADGSYYIILPSPSQPKQFILNISYLGYKDRTDAIEVLPIDDGESIIRNYELEPDPLTLKDVTITANKVEEELQDVPIAATVIDADNLEKRTVADTEEAFAIVPNLVTDSYLPSRATFSLRGLASDFTNLGVENSVGMYIDDVYYSRSFNFNQSLIDIERVEVLRGPQGTLFGKNTIGGVLHVIPEKPKFGNFGAVELNGGNFRYLQVRAKGNVELVENKLALRISGAYRQRDGYLIEKNQEIEGENGLLFYGGRASLRYQPSDKVEISLKGHYGKDERAPFTIDYKTPDDGFDRIAIDEAQKDYNDRQVFQNENDVFFFRENYGGVGRVDVKLGKVHKLTSISSFNRTDSDFKRDFDATSADVGTFSKKASIDAFTQEIRIGTPRENRKFFWMGGVFFLQETFKDTDTLRAQSAMVPIWTAAFASQGLDIDISDPNYEEAVYNNSTINSTSIAGFLSGSVEVSDRIRINAGIRFTNESKDIDFWQGCQCSGFPVAQLGGLPLSPMGVLVAPPAGSEETPQQRSITNNAFSGNVGMDFKTTDKTLVYVNFSRGFKGAGFNVSFSPESDPEKIPFVFDTETINSYEVGLKIKTQNRYLFNLAAFVTDFRNKQEVVAVGNTVIVANAKAVQGQGVEAEFTGVWSDFFKTDVSLGALNMKYTDFPFDNPTTPGVDENLSGNRAFKAAPFTFKFAPELHTEIGKDLKLLLRADYNFIGKTYNDIFNTEGLARQGVGTLNARLAFSTRNERFGIAIWGKNLTDELYIQHGWTFIFGDHVSVNPPRMVGVELRANFY